MRRRVGWVLGSLRMTAQMLEFLPLPIEAAGGCELIVGRVVVGDEVPTEPGPTSRGGGDGSPDDQAEGTGAATHP